MRGSAIRNRILLLCLLPTLLFGATYLLLVEFVLRESTRIAEVPPLLRYGGVGLVVLFVFVSLGCALSLADGVLRPMRALQRIAGESETGNGPEAYDLQTTDPDLRRLFLRVNMIAQQNRAGMQARAELMALQREVSAIRSELRRFWAGEGIPGPTNPTAGGSVSGLAGEADRLWAGLRAKRAEMETTLQSLEGGLAQMSAGGWHGVLPGLDRLERLGTVWSLEVELARRRSPQMSGDLGSCFREFTSAIAELRRMAQCSGPGEDSLAHARSEVARLCGIVAEWLRTESEVGGADSSSTSLRGEHNE